MTLRDLLWRKRKAIAQRWAAGALAAYPDDSAKLFSREKDPFANPIGRSLREGTQAIVEGLIEGRDTKEIRGHLDDVIRIRAVQQLAPSQAVGFVFDLKTAVRAELEGADLDREVTAQLALLDEQVDHVALAAFDVYVGCREEVSDLRVNEVKRSVSWVIDRINKRADREGEPGRPIMETTEEVNVRREGVR